MRTMGGYHPTHMAEWFAVAIGGALGASVRYGVALWLGFGMRSTLPVNLLGALLVGFVYPTLSQKSGLPALFILTGFLGGLTTFSAMTLEGVGAGRDPLLAGWVYTFLSVGAGLALAKGGLFLAGVFSK